MNAMQIIRAALSRRRSPSYGMDGGTGWEGFVDLQAHDDQYHHGHYDGGTCKLREKIGQAPDLISQIGIALPNHSAMQRALSDARESGLLDEQTAGDIATIENEIRQRLNDLDSGNVDLEEIGELAKELNTVYRSISDAMMVREDAHEIQSSREGEGAPAPRAVQRRAMERGELTRTQLGDEFHLPRPDNHLDGYEFPPLSEVTFGDIDGKYLAKLGLMVPASLNFQARSSAGILSRDMGLAMQKILLNPGGHTSFVNAVRGLDDCPFKERFLTTLDVVCDKILENRLAAEERNRSLFSVFDMIADNPSELLTEEQADAMRRPMAARFGQFAADEMLKALRDPSYVVPNGAANTMRNFVDSVGDTGRFAKSLIKAHNAVHPRKKILTEEEINRYTPPMPPEVMAQDDATAAEYGISRTDNGLPSYNGRSGHSNCWVNDNCMNMGFRGFDVSPVLNGGAFLRWFGECKMAMAKAY